MKIRIILYILCVSFNLSAQTQTWQNGKDMPIHQTKIFDVNNYYKPSQPSHTSRPDDKHNDQNESKDESDYDNSKKTLERLDRQWKSEKVAEAKKIKADKELIDSINWMKNATNEEITQIVKIPDANFKAALIEEGVDLNKDGQILKSEAMKVTSLYIDEKNITSLEGIQSFKNLEDLHCRTNHLKSIDISKNERLQTLYIDWNDIKDIDITQNSALKILSYEGDAIKEIIATQALAENNQLNLDKQLITIIPNKHKK